MKRRAYLDEPYILERTALHQIQALLRPLAHASESPLPLRMRTRCAQMHRRCAALARELHRTPDAIRTEKAREEAR